MSSATASPLRDYWGTLPEELKGKLRLGFTGKQHLLDIAAWCLNSGNAALHPIAADAIQTAFGERPLDGGMAREMLSYDVVRAILPEETLSLMQAVADNWHSPAESRFEQLVAGRDLTRIKGHIEKAVAQEPDNLFWRAQVVAFGYMDNDLDWAAAMLDFTPQQGAEPALSNIRAWLASLRGESHAAARYIQETGSAYGSTFATIQGAMHTLAGGDQATASLLVLQCLPQAPWNMSLLLCAHDLLTGLSNEKEKLPGSVAVLLYSWNKEIELDATLRSLLESDLPDASLFILDNGSTDKTGEILGSWQLRFDARLGPGRFTVVSLPVNIGAPAARNWLMHLDAVKAHDFICYLDDDVELPKDWLLRLGAAVHHYPDAGVWGCKVVDHANPAFIQHADGHLLIDPEAVPLNLARTAPNPSSLSDLHLQTHDSGLFSMLRPCASVTGCCHLFRTEALLESGDFAIHLSPSQYDDWEHDLRLCEAGKFPVYQGHLVIRHKKSTGAASRKSMQEEGNALGNKYKMQTMHDHADMVEAMRAEQAVLEADILMKMKVVENILAG